MLVIKNFFATNNGQLIVRILAALFGGYILTYSALAALALVLPWPRLDVVFFSALFPGFLWLAALLWAFVAPTPSKAWGGILGGATVCGIVAVVAAQIH